MQVNDAETYVSLWRPSHTTAYVALLPTLQAQACARDGGGGEKGRWRGNKPVLFIRAEHPLTN